MSDSTEAKVSYPQKHSITDAGSSSKEGLLDLKTLFVRSIPFEATDEELADYFSQLAPIKHAVIVKDNEKQSRGFGFVSFAVEDDTKEALAKSRKTKFQGRLLRVDIARRRDRSKKDAGHGTSNDTSVTEQEEDDLMKGKPKLIIRNMPWSVRNPDELKKIFTRFGTVVEAKIPKKKDGKLCGFAFVTMKKLAACKRAIEESKGLKIGGRQVAVDFAVQKSRWEDYKKEHSAEQENNESSSESEKEVEEDELSQGEASDSIEEEAASIESDSDLETEESDSEKNEVIEQPRKKQNRQEQYSVFVRNVPYDATQESLSLHFSKFGPVKYALPVQDKETGLAKGTAFVAFKSPDAYEECIRNAPAAGSTSLLISDDVAPQYVYEGRVLSITPALDRDTAERNAEKSAAKRKEAFGKAPGEKDRRNLYLLNEGRITEGSKLAELLTPTDMEIREKSYQLRVEQLKKNPSLHLSLTRLAIRNIPRAMTEKALKGLARKAVVEFAKEVKDGKRHALSKEEIVRSTNEKYKFMEPADIEALKKRDKKKGLVRQAKIIMEVKGANSGRSRGYGFVEFRDHKSALMGLRWLNAHEVTRQELIDGLTEEEAKQVDTDGLKKRRMCVEFAIENANVVKRRREKILQSRTATKRGREVTENEDKSMKKSRHNPEKTNSKEPVESQDKSTSGISDDIKRIIGFKRKRKHGKK